MPDLLEAAAGVEEVAAPGETVGSVDLTTISQQLDQVIVWQAANFGTQWILIGCLIGAVVALVIGGIWK